jgi:hypothetical protein
MNDGVTRPSGERRSARLDIRVKRLVIFLKDIYAQKKKNSRFAFLFTMSISFRANQGENMRLKSIQTAKKLSTIRQDGLPSRNVRLSRKMHSLSPHKKSGELLPGKV